MKRRGAQPREEPPRRRRRITTPPLAASPPIQPLIPIVALGPHMRRWRFRGVVSKKSEIKDGRHGKFFTFTMMDSEGKEIMVTCGGGNVTRFYHFIKVESTYYMEGDSKVFKDADGRFNTTGHEYEIWMDDNVVITESEDEVLQLPTQSTDAVKLSSIHQYVGRAVDVVGVVVDRKGPEKTNTVYGEKDKLTVTLVDGSGCAVQLTVWGKSCSSFTPALLYQPIILKDVEVNEYEGVHSLVFRATSRLVPYDGNDEVAVNLSEWYDIFGIDGAITRDFLIRRDIVAGQYDMRSWYFTTYGRICSVEGDEIDVRYHSQAQWMTLPKQHSDIVVGNIYKFIVKSTITRVEDEVVPVWTCIDLSPLRSNFYL
uniref:REPA_OB_2 domain-containing protein n=1 Tax=Strongyloides papillosus TaxID=174720 RepID=A0A0N5BMP8_STREA